MKKLGLLIAAWGDGEERMRGLVYKSPLPPDLKPPLDRLPSMEE